MPWFRVMDPRLMALPQVQRDLARVNVDPAARHGSKRAGAERCVRRAAMQRR
ncbi:MAG: hypothetical protein U1F25_09475 [Rubrivivax sp.]